MLVRAVFPIAFLVFSAVCSHDVEFTMQRHHEDMRTDGACGEISCRYGRNGVNVTRIRMNEVKVIGKDSHLLAELTVEAPSVDSVSHGYEIKGKLSPGQLGGKIEIRLLNPSACHHGVFSCDVTYDDENESGLTDMAIMGPGLLDKGTFEETNKDTDEESTSTEGSTKYGDNCFRLVAQFSEKTATIEQNLDYKIDRIERVLSKRNDHVTDKLAEVERAMSAKLTGLESRFDEKYTRLDTRVDARLDKSSKELLEQMGRVETRLSQDLSSYSSQCTDLQKQLDDVNWKEADEQATVSQLKGEIQDVVGSSKFSKAVNQMKWETTHKTQRPIEELLDEKKEINDRRCM
ncbi:hypothetical protein EGW08_002376 [Elysia chlorotica]|uniref:Uncharacterized protein n=1 Tax=Elysia chlorotica TaxID=188477 RepID=A0A3S1BRS2_ELYCH|nr:hypothetical protein EGW08_002376 [Elysia chlorotica]